MQYEWVKYNKCVRLPDSGGRVLDCNSDILSPLLFDGPQLRRSISVCSSLYLLTRAHCAYVLPWLPCGWPRTCWKRDTITRLCASHACVTWSAKSLSFFPSCTSSFLSSVQKSPLTTDPRLPTTKLVCSNSHFGAAALSALMMLLCCPFASASVTSRNLSSLSVRLNCKIDTICRFSLIAAPEERPWIEVVLCLFSFFDWYCYLYILCLLHQFFLAANS